MPPPPGLFLFHFCKKTVRGRGQASPRSDQREVPSRQAIPSAFLVVGGRERPKETRGPWEWKG